MLRTGQLRRAPPRPRDLARRRGPRYRGPWRLPGPDSHRLAAVSLSLGYVVVPSFRWSSAPELAGRTFRRNYRENREPAAASCHYREARSGSSVTALLGRVMLFMP